MDIDLAAFHFLRPAWLLLVPFGALLPLLWRRSRALERRLGSVAPELLRHLIVSPRDDHRLRPAHLACALLVLGAVGAAGPTWEQDRPAFLANRAPLLLALDLSPSMNASDVPPSRLEAAKHKLHDLILRRAGARTGLIAYAGSAHLVLPPTDDPALLDSFLQALSSDLIERPGKNVLAVVEQARRLLAAEQAPGTLVLLTDGADPSQFDALGKALQASELQVLVLAVGSQDGGVILDANGQPRTDASGRPALGSFDAAALKQLAAATDAPLGSLSLNDDDLDWIELHAQQHFEDVNDSQRQAHWKDAGYWLCWPLALLAFLAIRRGWNLNWSAALLLCIGAGLAPGAAHAGALADAFLSADQQGRWAFEHGHYPAATERFHDPYWKGLAAYRAADYDLALACFARLDSAAAYFYLGNIHVRRFKLDQAIAAYRRALELQPQFPEASANLALAIALERERQSAADNAPHSKADEIRYDDQGRKGKSVKLQALQAVSDDLWLQNLSTSPAQFLKRKFSLQDARQASPGASP